MTTIRRGRRRRALLLLCVLAAGCADLTSGGATGEAEAHLAGDDPSPTAGPASSARGATPPAGAALQEAAATASIDASVTVGIRVFLEGGPDGAVELTSGARTHTVPAQGGAAVRIATRRVAAGGYARARVVFTRVEADVRSGLVVGGVPIVGIVRVSASPQDPVEIERAVVVEVEEDAAVAVLVDLNAPVWLAAASPATSTVARAAFEAAVEVKRR